MDWIIFLEKSRNVTMNIDVDISTLKRILEPVWFSNGLFEKLGWLDDGIK